MAASPVHRLSSAPRRPVRALLAALLLGLASAASLSAQQPDPDEGLPDRNFPALRELLDKALAQSPQILQRNFALARAEAQTQASRAGMLPSLNANGRYAWEKASTNGSTGEAGYGAYYTIGFSQPLFHWGERAANHEIGQLSLLIARKSYAEAYRDLAASIRGQFLRLIQAKSRLSVRQADMAARERRLQEVRTRHANGLASMTELGSHEIQFNEASHELALETFRYDQSRLALARLCGVPELPDAQVPAELIAPACAEQQALRLVAQFDQSDAARALPPVLAESQAVRQSELRYRNARYRQFPKFDLSASTGLENQTYLSSSSLSQSATRRHMIGVTGNWNLFDGFATRAAKREALASLREAELRLKLLIEGLDDQKRALVTRYDLCVRSLRFAEESLGRMRAAHIEAQENARLGLLPASQVEQYRVSMLNAEVAAMSARIDVYGCWNELVAVLWLDPVLKNLPPRYLAHGSK